MWHINMCVPIGDSTREMASDSRRHHLDFSVKVEWSLLADLVLSVEAEIERRSPMPLRPFLHVQCLLKRKKERKGALVVHRHLGQDSCAGISRSARFLYFIAIGPCLQSHFCSSSLPTEK